MARWASIGPTGHQLVHCRTRRIERLAPAYPDALYTVPLVMNLFADLSAARERS
jgi:hypothetical protein